MNQVSGQNAKTHLEKDFYKLMNNSNFDYDRRNNADNCYFHPIYDKTEELSYAKQYQNVFDQDISEFVSTDILERQIEEKTSKNSQEIKKKQGLVFSMKKSRQKKHKKNSIKHIDQKQKEEEQSPKTKSIIELDLSFAYSIKSLAVKKK